MKFISVCSGIEAASVAWSPLGWKAVGFSEIEPFPSSVLAHHYPSVPNLGDMTQFKEWPDAAIDVLGGGTPCQSFSVAGLRKGLDDPRGNLMLVYGAIAAKYRPQWLVWENVPGVLSSNGGRDFGTFLGMLGQLGYGFAYRVLDAQYFGVAQRRRRVFVVGCLGDWRRAAAVLFERHSLQGHPAPRREARETIAGTITRGAFDGGAGGRPEGAAGNHFLGVGAPELARCVTTGEAKRQDYETCTLIAHSLRGEGFDASEGGTGRGTPLVPVTYGIDYEHNAHSVFDATGPLLKGSSSGGGHPLPAIAVRGISQTLTSNYGKQVDSSDTALGPNVVFPAMQVRRLTPRECERLQGFPDDYTLIQVRGKPAADGPRYKALGNSMAVPVMRWIGQRIDLVSTISLSEAA